MGNQLTGAPVDGPRQHVFFIEEPNTWQLSERRWRPAPSAPPPPLLQGTLEPEVWSQFCNEMQRLTSCYWTDGFFLGLGLPLVVVLTSIIGTVAPLHSMDGPTVVCFAVAFWMCVVGTVKWLNEGVDEKIGSLVEWLSGYLPSDAVEVSFEIGWTGIIKPVGSKTWRAVVVTSYKRQRAPDWATTFGAADLDGD